MTLVHSYGRTTTVGTIRRIRKIPRGSKVQVKQGQGVKALETLAVAERPQEYQLLNIAEALRIKPKDIMKYLPEDRQIGEPVEEGQVLAERKILFGLRSLQAVAPITGLIARIDGERILIAGDVVRQELLAAAPGRVTFIEPESHLVIETKGTLIQVAWGHGGMAWGTLKVIDDAPGLDTQAGQFNIDHRGSIIAIGSPLTKEFLKGAVEIRVKGLIAASAPASMVSMIKAAGFPVGLVQGFGHSIMMDQRIYNTLSKNNGRELSLDMGHDQDWRDYRPEIIIPTRSQEKSSEDQSILKGLQIGHLVRVLQSPYLGEIGTVATMPGELRQLKSGLWMPGVMVDMPDGRTIYVPIANLEHLG